MAIYIGMTQDLVCAREYLLTIHAGMAPDIEMGPFKKKEEAIGYIHFMKNRFPNAIEIQLPLFPVRQEDSHKWFVFSLEHQGIVH
ncbi:MULTISPECIES: hypothetical protein [Desulfosediminicola]|uniref:hypothetical protein n=1 Tax=Desulfosediminicola TaxID=2886823 RepID=UPI0010AC72AC|nr:hypothetical protein [Desulfosediminicola ganghwensis]